MVCPRVDVDGVTFVHRLLLTPLSVDDDFALALSCNNVASRSPIMGAHVVQMLGAVQVDKLFIDVGFNIGGDPNPSAEHKLIVSDSGLKLAAVEPCHAGSRSFARIHSCLFRCHIPGVGIVAAAQGMRVIGFEPVRVRAVWPL